MTHTVAMARVIADAGQPKMGDTVFLLRVATERGRTVQASLKPFRCSVDGYQISGPVDGEGVCTARGAGRVTNTDRPGLVDVELARDEEAGALLRDWLERNPA